MSYVWVLGATSVSQNGVWDEKKKAFELNRESVIWYWWCPVSHYSLSAVYPQQQVANKALIARMSSSSSPHRTLRFFEAVFVVQKCAARSQNHTHLPWSGLAGDTAAVQTGRRAWIFIVFFPHVALCRCSIHLGVPPPPLRQNKVSPRTSWLLLSNRVPAVSNGQLMRGSDVRLLRFFQNERRKRGAAHSSQCRPGGH